MNRDVAQDRIIAARHLKLAGKSQSRTRRPTLEEIDRIAWEGFHEAAMTQLVRDMKHPGQTKGNDVRSEKPPEALRAMRL